MFMVTVCVVFRFPISCY